MMGAFENIFARSSELKRDITSDEDPFFKPPLRSWDIAYRSHVSGTLREGYVEDDISENASRVSREEEPGTGLCQHPNNYSDYCAEDLTPSLPVSIPNSEGQVFVDVRESQDATYIDVIDETTKSQILKNGDDTSAHSARDGCTCYMTQRISNYVAAHYNENDQWLQRDVLIQTSALESRKSIKPDDASSDSSSSPPTFRPSYEALFHQSPKHFEAPPILVCATPRLIPGKITPEGLTPFAPIAFSSSSDQYSPGEIVPSVDSGSTAPDTQVRAFGGLSPRDTIVLTVSSLFTPYSSLLDQFSRKQRNQRDSKPGCGIRRRRRSAQ
eukprot:Blabericola_migrator_1__2452@NODE_168_length_12126_cov_91_620864_g146_i0_p5_GENE_NODE_168_length_12126_cov_91_620864_g146_i0NODE_168_length_12126_cov_91_620864_g146_i0_p5_ORF_typecomplete_len326_score32_79_NODE_168_length_12126_cov_91_620864_g146_i05811558